MKSLAAVVAITWLCAPVARADRAGADRLSDEANALAANKDFTGAAAKFRAAYVEDPRGDLLCNVGIAYQRAKLWPRAQMYLSQCLVRGASVDRAVLDSVRVLLTSVEDKLRAGDFTPVDIVVAPGGASVAIDGFDPEDAFIGSRLVWLPFGSHAITIAMEGYTAETRTVDAVTHDTRTVKVELAKAAPVDTPKPPPVDTPKPPPERPLVHPPPPPPPVHRSLAIPLGTTAGAAVLGGVAIVELLAAQSNADDANQLAKTALDPVAYQSKVDAAHRDRLIAVTTGVCGGLAAGAAVYLWVRYVKTPSRLEVATHPGGATLSVSGRF